MEITCERQMLMPCGGEHTELMRGDLLTSLCALAACCAGRIHK